MTKMQDSMASSVVRGRPFSHAGEIVTLRRQDSMGQYGRLVFVIKGGSRFTENSAPRWPLRPFSRICRQCTTGRERGREMRFCQGGSLATPHPSEKNPGQPPCLLLSRPGPDPDNHDAHTASWDGAAHKRVFPAKGRGKMREVTRFSGQRYPLPRRVSRQAIAPRLPVCPGGRPPGGRRR